MSKREEREKRFARVWERMLVKEPEWRVECLEDGFIKIPPTRAILNCFYYFYWNDFARKEAPLLLKVLRGSGRIQVLPDDGPGRPLIGFQILKRDPLPITPLKPKKEKEGVDQLTTRLITKTGEELGRQVIAALEKIGVKVIPTRTQERPKILVLIDTANFGENCRRMGVFMPLDQFFHELAKIGDVIGSFAFYNKTCPDGILRLFANHHCLLIACIDNKSAKPPEGKTDWIDESMKIFVNKFLPFLDFDIGVIISHDGHFIPIKNLMKQWGKKVIRCIADKERHDVYFLGDYQNISLKTQKFPQSSFIPKTNPTPIPQKGDG